MLPMKLLDARAVLAFAMVFSVCGTSHSAEGFPLPKRWKAAGVALKAAPVGGVDWHAVKDPSLVRHEGRWHLFCTVRGAARSHAVVYLNFRDWSEAAQAERHVLGCHAGYFCAPQVFYFTPEKLWYMVCQASDDSWTPKYQPAYSTSTNLVDPRAWTALRPMWPDATTAPRAWLDFWVISSGDKAHLFFTSLDGRMWRSETPTALFPTGWSKPALALEGDIFEASHTYKLRGREGYITLVEAQNGHGWRYYKAYVADRLEGPWSPAAAGRDDAFASMLNTEQADGRWTDVVSHGELLRSGVDERMEIDPGTWRFLIQGVRDEERAGLDYGRIPWRLGWLESLP